MKKQSDLKLEAYSKIHYLKLLTNSKIHLLKLWVIPHFRNLTKFTKTELLVFALYGLFVFTFSNVLSPAIQQWGITEYYSIFPSGQIKPFVAVIMTPGNLSSFKNDTIFIDNPQNLTVSSFAFYIEPLNSTAKQNMTVSAHIAKGKGNIELTFPYGNSSERELYVVAHDIRPGDSSTLNVSLSLPSRINVTVTRTDARYCTEYFYVYANIHYNNPGPVNPLHEDGNCPIEDIPGFLYKITGSVTVSNP